MYTYSKTIPVIAEPDVFIAGSGSAGSTAAIAAARELHSSNPQAKVMLVERYGFLGGTSTAVLDTFYGFYTPGTISKKVVSGIPDDVVAGLRKLDRVIERPNTFGAGTGVTYNPEYLKVVWERLAQEAGVDLLLHTFITDVLLEDGRITGIVVDGKAGLGLIRPKVIVDATGDADVCALAQVPFEKAGDIDPAQTLTTTFKVANVDVAAARKLPRADFLARMGEAADSGKYDLPRREGSVHITPIEGVMATIMTRLEAADPTNPRDLTLAEIEGRRQALEYERFLRDYIPGYEAARLVTFSTQIGVRETRRVYGEYRLTREMCSTPGSLKTWLGCAALQLKIIMPGRARSGCICRMAPPWIFPIERWFRRRLKISMSRAAASRRRTMHMRPYAAWRNVWLWGRQPGRQRRCAFLRTVRRET